LHTLYRHVHFDNMPASNLSVTFFHVSLKLFTGLRGSKLIYIYIVVNIDLFVLKTTLTDWQLRQGLMSTAFKARTMI